MAQEPIEYLILTNLRDALTQIKIGNGYYYDVRDIAIKLDPNQDVETLAAPDGPRPFIVLEVLAERREFMPSMRVRIIRPVTIHWISDSVPERDEDRMHTFFRGISDVEKAITVDIQRGGYALDHRLLRTSFDTSLDGSQVWAVIETDILEQVRTYGLPDVTV